MASNRRSAPHTRQLKLTEKDREISQIQRRRIKALRKLSEARKKVEGGRQPRDVVMEYADYGSEAYAPMTRNGNITLDKQVLARASPRAPTPHPSPPPPSPPPHRPYRPAPRIRRIATRRSRCSSRPSTASRSSSRGCRRSSSSHA